MAASGLRFTSFYMSPTGVPSRAAVVTGQYSPRTGVFGSEVPERADLPTRRTAPPETRASLPEGVGTIASVLKESGYATALFGEWQLGAEGAAHPRERGYGETVLVSGGHLRFTTDPAMELAAGTYVADFLTDRALDFMNRHREEPFFLQVDHVAVRAPYEPKPGVIAKFEKKAPAGSHRDAAYAAMIASLDESVGRILAKVAELKIEDRTVILFTSDNGGAGGYADPDAAGRRLGVTDNAPLRGGRGMLYEGGIRVPFLVRWSGVTPAGGKSAQPGLHVDLFPTICDIAQVRPPATHAVDGVSLLPLFRDPGAHLGRDAIYWHFPAYVEGEGRSGWRTTPAGAVRAGNFKLLEFFEDGRLELYNLVEDLGEKDNLVRSLPDKTAELRGKLAGWRKALNAPMPVPVSAPAAAPAPPTVPRVSP